MSRLCTQLEAVLRPLLFAARDDFAHCDRIRDLEGAVSAACRRVLAGALPSDLRAALVRIADAFELAATGEASASPQHTSSDRAAIVRRALALLEPYLDPGWPAAALARSPRVLAGVGPRRAEVLSKRGLGSIDRLLFHLPTGYDDRRALVDVGDLEVGLRATFLAQVQSVGSSMSRGRFGRVLEAVVGDDTGSISLKWFRGGDALEAGLRKGSRILVTGDVRRHRFAKQLVHPELEFLDANTPPGSDPEDAVTPSSDPTRLSALRRLVPQYPTPEGIPPRTLRRLVERAVSEYADLISGFLPRAIVQERGLPEPCDALRAVHAPPGDADARDYTAFVSSAHERLVLEELYLLELGLALRHGETARLPGIALDLRSDRMRAAPAGLPFALTPAQHRAWEEIARDLARPHPMNRLLQGDVGCGKTAVAFLAAVAAAANGFQAALMAPTELLAEQHARSLAALVEQSSPALKLRILLLTASLSRADIRAGRRLLAAGEVDLAIGTHALLSKEVEFSGLGVVIIDEQHRFGVKQRQALRAKLTGDRHPHTLVMTATPIPRTLALTLYGDLDVSVIDALPPGRKPVRTLLLRSGEGAAVTRLIEEHVARGEQVYVVYPLVEESEKVDLRSAMESAERIARAFPQCRVDLIHGRQAPDERRSAMQRFEQGETTILVSTTVIEVGVDVARATLMVIEHAERFGLAQLHQLRGRVGRGAHAGTCVLMSRAHSGGGTVGEGIETSEERLKAMLATTDGFEIANADLRIRGPGEFLGTRQAGHLPDLQVADLLRDQRLLAAARNAAFETVRSDPGLARAPDLRQAVELRWGDKLALVDVG